VRTTERRRGCAAAASLLAVALALGCERSSSASPEETVAAFVAALEQARSDPAQRKRVYDLLSAGAQHSLSERARRASQVSGWELKPWEMLAPGRMRLRVQVDPELMTTRVSGERAVVTARGRAGGAADVPLVREGSAWRIDLDLPPITDIRPGDVDAGR
jgi:hypothetical protein